MEEGGVLELEGRGYVPRTGSGGTPFDEHNKKIRTVARL